MLKPWIKPGVTVWTPMQNEGEKRIFLTKGTVTIRVDPVEKELERTAWVVMQTKLGIVTEYLEFVNTHRPRGFGSEKAPSFGTIKMLRLPETK